MSGVITKIIFTAAVAVVGAVVAYLVARPQSNSNHENRRRRRPAPPTPTNRWESDYDTDSNIVPNPGSNRRRSRPNPEAKEEFACSICLDTFKELIKKRVSITKCGHLFCRDCIVEFLEMGNGSNNCPICRKEVCLNDLSSVHFA